MSDDFLSLQQLSTASAKDLVVCSQRGARELLDFEDAAALGVLPISIVQYGKQKILIAAATGEDTPDLNQALRFATGHECKIFSVAKDKLAPVIFEAYHRDADALVSVVKDLQEENSEAAVRLPELSLQARSQTGDAGRLLAALLDLAIAQNASDVQLSPRRDGMYVTLRVQGERKTLVEPLCSCMLAKKLVNRIRILSKLDTTQVHVPQDGSFEVEMPHGARPVRVSLLPTLHGSQVALRFFGSVQERSVHHLFTDSAVAAISERALKDGSGLILLAGSTGSGKTTTLYSFMQYLVKQNLNVISLEDPVEAEISGVSQTSIDSKKGLSYAAALKSALRQDPDAILIGEIRDSEVAAIACEAALTGHLVLTTLHAGNTKEVFVRLRQLITASFPDPERMLQAVNLVICQKLVPELCETCRVIDLEASNAFAIHAAKAVGCTRCDYTGFAGRVCIAEAFYSKNIRTTVTQYMVDEFEAQGLFCAPKKQLMRLFATGRISAETVANEYFDSVWDT